MSRQTLTLFFVALRLNAGLSNAEGIVEHSVPATALHQDVEQDGEACLNALQVQTVKMESDQAADMFNSLTSGGQQPNDEQPIAPPPLPQHEKLMQHPTEVSLRQNSTQAQQDNSTLDAKDAESSAVTGCASYCGDMNNPWSRVCESMASCRGCGTCETLRGGEISALVHSKTSSSGSEIPVSGCWKKLEKVMCYPQVNQVGGYDPYDTKDSAFYYCADDSSCRGVYYNSKSWTGGEKQKYYLCRNQDFLYEPDEDSQVVYEKGPRITEEYWSGNPERCVIKR